MNFRKRCLGMILCLIAMPVAGCGQGGSGPIEASKSEIEAYKAQKAEDAKINERLISENSGEL